jgi:hypothetical protein
MPSPIVTYGRPVTAAEAYFGWTIANQTGVTVFNKLPKNFWATHVYVWGGKYTGTNVDLYLGVYDCESDNINPDKLKGRTGKYVVTNSKGGASGGQKLGGAIVRDGDDRAVSAIQMWSDRRYGVGHSTPVGQLNFSMQASANISNADNRRLYRRNGISGFPVNLKPYTTSDIEGHVSAWVEGHYNVRPSVGTMAPSGTVNEIAPTFTGEFRDANAGYGGGTDVGDYLHKFRIQVATDDGSETIMWDSGFLFSTSAERAADQFSRAYAGAALTRGVGYKWRCVVYDRFVESSDWSSWVSFTVADLGYITAGDAPAGKIETDQPDFQYRWQHQSSKNTNAVRVQLNSAEGVVIATSGWISKTTAPSADPGTLDSVTWAATGFAALTKGRAYTYQVQGRDVDNVVSAWSDKLGFWVNDPPAVPTNLSPNNAEVVTSYPLLTVTATDTDDDSTTGHVVYAETYDTANALIATRTMAYNPSTGRWEYQTVSGDHPDGYGVYSARYYAYDGTYYSGGATSAGAAARSPLASWTYAAGPVVAIDDPDGGVENPITEAAIPVAWTVSSGGPQAAYRLVLHTPGTTDYRYDSGWITSVATDDVIGADAIENLQAYELQVGVRNNLAVVGWSPRRYIVIDYTPPDAITGFAASEWRGANDPWPTGIALFWDQSLADEAEFRYYLLTAEGGGITRVIARIYSQATTTVVDYDPPSGVEQTYRIIQVIETDESVLASEPTEIAMSVDLGGVVLTDVEAPESRRMAFNLVMEHGYQRRRRESMHIPLAGPLLPDGSRGPAEPVTTRSTAYWKEFDLKVLVVNQVGFTLDPDSVLQQAERADALGGVFCLRDNRGNRSFVTITEFAPQQRRTRGYDLDIKLRTETYAEELVSG